MKINSIPFPIYEIMIVISVLTGITYIYLSLKNEKIPKKNILLFFIFFFIFAILIGKLYTFIAYGFKTSYIKSHLSAYGGLIGVVIAAIIYEKFCFSNNLIIKYTILSLPLIYSFTKIGCFFVGCCYGIPYNGPFNITYPHVINKPLFPIQFVEIIIFFVLFIFCNTNKEKKYITYFTLSMIAILKFIIEFLRYNHINTIITPNQIFSLILLIITIIIFIKNKSTINDERESYKHQK